MKRLLGWMLWIALLMLAIGPVLAEGVDIVKGG